MHQHNLIGLHIPVRLLVTLTEATSGTQDSDNAQTMQQHQHNLIGQHLSVRLLVTLTDSTSGIDAGPYKSQYKSLPNSEHIATMHQRPAAIALPTTVMVLDS